MARLCCILLFLAGGSVIAAEYPTAVTFGVGESSSTLAVRRAVAPRWSVLVSAGGGSSDLEISRNGELLAEQSTTFWSVGPGLRYEFGVRPLLPFAQAEITYSRIRTNACRDALSSTGVALSGGVAYFLAERVSIEGSAGIIGAVGEPQCSSDATVRAELRSLTTFRSALAISFHF